MASRRSSDVDDGWEDADGSGSGSASWSSVQVAEDRRAFRQASATHSRRSSRVQAVPQHIAMLRRYFPGRRGFFTELASFRRKNPRMPNGVRRMLASMINALALMRIATLRPASQCHFCTRVDAPMCALAPCDLHPVGAKQHPNARSKKCIVARAFNTAPTSRSRLLALFANHQGELRLIKDTDDQANSMHMLPLYATTLWNAAHQLGIHAVVDDIDIVLLQHGIPTSNRTHNQPLEASFQQLLDSVGSHHADLVSRLVRQHMRIFGADYADLAMQAIVVLLQDLVTQAHAEISYCMDPPVRWLQQEAVAIHAVYEAETYTSGGRTLQVQRTHAQAQEWLDTWKLAWHSPSESESTADSIPPTAGRTRRIQELDPDSDIQDTRQDEEHLVRGASKRRRLQTVQAESQPSCSTSATVRSRDESQHQEALQSTAAKRRRIHPPRHLDDEQYEQYEHSDVDEHDDGILHDTHHGLAVHPPRHLDNEQYEQYGQSDVDDHDDGILYDTHHGLEPIEALPPCEPVEAPREQLEPAAGGKLVPPADTRGRRLKQVVVMLTAVGGCACICIYTYWLGWTRSQQHLTHQLTTRAYSFVQSLPPPPPRSG